MTSTSSFGSSVITLQFDLNLNIDVAEQEVQAAINAAATLSADRSADSADLQQDQSGRRADSDAGADLDTHAAVQGGGPGRHAAGAENLAAARRRPGEHQRRPEAGRARPGESRRRWRPTASSLEDLRTALAAANVNQAKGNFDGPQQAYTIGANDQLLSSSDYTADRHRLPQRRAGARCPTSPTSIDGAENTKQAAWMNETPGRDREHSAAARRQHHQRGRPHQGAAAAARRRRCRRPSTCRS